MLLVLPKKKYCLDKGLTCPPPNGRLNHNIVNIVIHQALYGWIEGRHFCCDYSGTRISDMSRSIPLVERNRSRGMASLGSQGLCCTNHSRAEKGLTLGRCGGRGVERNPSWIKTQCSQDARRTHPWRHSIGVKATPVFFLPPGFLSSRCHKPTPHSHPTPAS